MATQAESPSSKAKKKKLLSETESMIDDLRIEVGSWEPPTNARWCDLANPILPTLRMAWLIVMHKTGAEVDEIIRSLDEDDPALLARLMRELSWAGGYLEQIAQLIQAAETRLFVHGAPNAIQDWLDDAPLPPEPPQNWRARPQLKIVARE